VVDRIKKGMSLGEPGDEKTDAIWAAKKTESRYDEHQKKVKAEIAALLERFRDDPSGTRSEVRRELGCQDKLAAEVFAIVVFVSDELLQLIERSTLPAARFVNIVIRLPLELQMVVCYRVVGSAKDIVPEMESEAAFKNLAKGFLSKAGTGWRRTLAHVLEKKVSSVF